MVLTRWFKRAIAECLTRGKAENPKDLNNTSVSYDPNILVKDYLLITEIHLGRGISQPTYDNYSLEILETVLTDLDITVTETEEKIEITISSSKYFNTNTYINEIGLVGLFRGKKILFDRTKVEPRIDISAGQTLLITYKLTF